MPIADRDRSLNVLVVEDASGDARLIREVFRQVNSAVRLHVATTGWDAMAFLKRQGRHSAAPRPDFIFLDLNLPKTDGFEILTAVKTDEHLKSIPTAILTTSRSEADVQRSMELQANCYLTKPMNFGEFEVLLHRVNDFWLKRVRLPHQDMTA